MEQALTRISRMEQAVQHAAQQSRDLTGSPTGSMGCSRVSPTSRLDQHAGAQCLDRGAARGEGRPGLRGRGGGNPAPCGGRRPRRAGGQRNRRTHPRWHRAGVAGMERGLSESRDGLVVAGSLEAALQNLKQASAAGVADVRAVAGLSQQIAAETTRILDESSDGAASRTSAHSRRVRGPMPRPLQRRARPPRRSSAP